MRKSVSSVWKYSNRLIIIITISSSVIIELLPWLYILREIWDHSGKYELAFILNAEYWKVGMFSTSNIQLSWTNLICNSAWKHVFVESVSIDDQLTPQLVNDVIKFSRLNYLQPKLFHITNTIAHHLSFFITLGFFSFQSYAQKKWKKWSERKIPKEKFTNNKSANFP